MAIAHVQNAVSINSGTTLAVTLTGAVGAGDLLVCVARFSGTAPANAVADNINGNWTQIANASRPGNNVYMYYFANSGAAGSNGLTITVTAGASGTNRISADEFSGVATSSPLDQATSVTTTLGTSWVCPATGAIEVGELVYAGAGTAASTITVTAGTTGGVAMTLGGTAITSGSIFSEYALSSGVGTQNASMTCDFTSGWSGGQATFMAYSSFVPTVLTLGGQTIDTGIATVTQGVGTVSATGLSGYDASDLPLLVPGDATRPERKVAPEGPVTLLAKPTVTNPLVAYSDNTVTLSQQAREVWVRNLSATDVYVEADAVATSGSWPVLAGETACLNMFTTVLHVYPMGSGVQVNQAGGLYIRAGI